MKFQVKNIVGSSKISPEPPSEYGSWKGYWIVKTYRTLALSIIPDMTHKCPLCGKEYMINDMVGGHVIKLNNDDLKWYVTLVCDTCNKTSGKESLLSVEETELVPMPSNI